MASPDLIDTPDALAHCIDALADAPWLALDTEFQREKTYFPQLCVVQIANADQAWAIDALALDLDPLWALLRRDDQIKVLHAASQDYELFVTLAGMAPQPLFDTQVAAGLLGIGDQIGYAGLVKAMLDIDVDKSLSRTDWTRRPLPPAALQYAVDDVIHLAVIYPQLRQQLTDAGRLAWLTEDCNAIADANRYRPDPETAWSRVKGLGRLEAPDQHVAARLAAWREQQAIARDRPRRWMLADAAILAIAQRRPASEEQLRAVGEGEISDKMAGRIARECLPALYDDLPDHVLVSDERPTPEARRQIKALSSLARDAAETAGLPPSLLATRSDITAIHEHGADADVVLLRGWRRALVGDAMLALRDQLLADTPAADAPA